MMTDAERTALIVMARDRKNNAVHLLGSIVAILRRSPDNDHRRLANAVDRAVQEEGAKIEREKKH